jgi:hypothetical protein
MTALLCCAIVTALSGHPQTKPPDVYASAIASYVAGDFDAAAQLLGQLQPRDITREVEARVAAHRRFGATTAARRQFEAAAMLHTEYALYVDVDDAQALFHLETAHLLLTDARAQLNRLNASGAPLVAPADVAEAERARDYLHHWYILAPAVILPRGLSRDARTLVNEAAKLFPRDTQIAFHRALVTEFEAVWEPRRSSDPQSQFRPNVDASGFDLVANTLHWGELVSTYRDILAADRDNHEARLHLAYALISLRRPNDARPELEMVRQRAADPYVLYLASLFLGRMDEGDHRLDAAARAYERALEVGPRYQSAYLALSLLEDRRGNAARAQEVVARFVALPRRDRERDPWWDYHTSRLPQADLDWLRRQVRQ